jgi:hypothetical protein
VPAARHGGEQEQNMLAALSASEHSSTLNNTPDLELNASPPADER